MFPFAEILKRQEIQLMSPNTDSSLLLIKLYKHRSLTTCYSPEVYINFVQSKTPIYGQLLT